MELNQIMNIIANNTTFDEKATDSVNQDNSSVLFKNYLNNAGYSQESNAARKIREDIENRLQKISFGSPKVKLNVSPKVYEDMAKDPKIKKKMDDIFDDFLSENGTLSWMIKEARVGGGEISLTIDNDRNTVYTGKLYGIPGWDEDENKSESAERLSKKLSPLLERKELIDSTQKFENKIISTNNNNNINQLIVAAQMFGRSYQKK